MLPVPEVPLPLRASNQLRRWQGEIDEIASYEDRVATAKRSFKSRNTTSSRTFAQVRANLAQMCRGARRCGYCEDSLADEVEHIWPKDLYPERVFVWDNLLLVCGPCNGPKNNQFAVFRPGEANPTHATRRAGAAILPPPVGEPVLIDPRAEDPTSFLELDLKGTFLVLPHTDLDGRALERARYTIRVLRLNDRDALIEARMEAYGSYRARLAEYCQLKASGESAMVLRPRRLQLTNMQHGFVWFEMKRQCRQIPELCDLFTIVPEALEW